MKKWMSIWVLMFVMGASLAVLGGCEADIDTDDDWGDDDAELEVEVD